MFLRIKSHTPAASFEQPLGAGKVLPIVRSRRDGAERKVQELREEKWARILSSLVKAAGKSLDVARKTPKLAAWKIEAARALRQSTTAGNAWISAHFVKAHPSRGLFVPTAPVDSSHG
jgi:hypothetical protein